MFKFLSKLFSAASANRSTEFEAKLFPTPECQFGAVAEVEFESWKDGRATLEASLKHSSIPDGSQIQVRVEGQEILSLTPRAGYAKEYRHFTPQQPAPTVSIGNTAEFIHQGVTVYRGAFQYD